MSKDSLSQTIWLTGATAIVFFFAGQLTKTAPWPEVLDRLEKRLLWGPKPDAVDLGLGFCADLPAQGNYCFYTGKLTCTPQGTVRLDSPGVFKK